MQNRIKAYNYSSLSETVERWGPPESIVQKNKRQAEEDDDIDEKKKKS